MDTLHTLIQSVESIYTNYKSIRDLLDTAGSSRQDNPDSLPVYELGRVTLSTTPLILMLTVGPYRCVIILLTHRIPR